MTGPITGARAGATDTRIRDATRADFAAITAIYAGHVRHGTTSFEIEPPGEDELIARWQAILARSLPYLVAILGSTVQGFAYAAPYRPRLAYRYTLEHSIYIARGAERAGLGSLLIEPLIERCTALGYRQMVAVIGDSANHASIGFHTRHGFRPAGVLPAVGYKFERWVDSVLMARPLGEGDRSPPRDP